MYSEINAELTPAFENNRKVITRSRKSLRVAWIYCKICCFKWPKMAGRVSFNLACIWSQRKKFHFFTDNKTVVECNCTYSAGCTTYLHLQFTGSSGLLHRLYPGFSEKRAPSIFRVIRVQGDGQSLTLKMEVGRSYANNEGKQGNCL